MTEIAPAPPGTPTGAALPLSTDRSFWLSHLVWPMLIIVPVFCLIEWSGVDRKLAHAVFYDSALHRWLGSGPNDWWAHGMLHNAGRWLCRVIGAIALIMWLLSFVTAGARRWRRSAGFVFVALALSVGLVGGLKVLTNVDCPWDLSEFGGDRPYVTLLGDRPDALPRAECFPGAHSSSGIALVCFYFVYRDRSRRKARVALAVGIGAWLLFSFAQEARGAHFLSHDFASVGIVWLVQVLLYSWFRKKGPLLEAPDAAAASL